MPPASLVSRWSSGTRRAIWFAAAGLLVVVATAALRALPHGAGFLSLLSIAAVLAALGGGMTSLWQHLSGRVALEHAIADLHHAMEEARASRARAEAEAEQKARLAALLDAALTNAPVGFAFFDRELRFLRVNETFAALTGVAPLEHIGQSLADLGPTVARHVETRLREVFATKQPIVNVESDIETPGLGAEIRNALWSFYPIAARAEELFGVGVVVTDVTELKELEDQLLQAQKMEAIGRLAGGVAHDFNNLLTVISSYAELIQYDPSMRNREELSEIRGATARAANLTRQLLAFSRRQAMEPRIVNPNDIVRGVEPMVSRLFDTNIQVRAALAPETPLIRVDPGQIEQVLMNLAINAADAMPEGGRLTIETSGTTLYEEQSKGDGTLLPGRYAVVRVRDTGHGMDAATVARIFEPFFTTKEPGRGTGLGLSTVYGIVTQSSGAVRVESAPGEGSCFSVYLPAVGDDSA